MKIELSDKLFHSVKSYDILDDNGFTEKIYTDKEKLDITKIKLEKIFSTGFILPRKDVLTIYGKGNFCNLNYNGDFISLVKVSKEEDNYDKTVNRFEPSAFEFYTKNEVSLVLNKSLLDENEVDKSNQKMPYEIQVKKPIDIKYIEAISLPSEIVTTPFFENNSLFDFNYISKEELVLKISRLDMILSLVNKYKLNIPVISIETGKIYLDNPLYREKVKKYLNK